MDKKTVIDLLATIEREERRAAHELARVKELSEPHAMKSEAVKAAREMLGGVISETEVQEPEDN